MNIGFVLRGSARKATGGSKVIYQYANFLAENEDNHIIIYFDLQFGILKYFRYIKIIRSLFAKIIVWVRPNWFRLNRNIKKKAIFSIDDTSIQDGDAVIATTVETAEPVAALHECKGRKFYFIQGFENWNWPDHVVLQSYKLRMTNITVADWLSKIVNEKSGEHSICIGNGIDTAVFQVKTPIKSRPVHSIAMQYSSAIVKGCSYAFETIRILQNKYQDLKVLVFSTEKKPSDLPFCCEYFFRADQQKVAEIDNSVSVFLCSSIEEGFGLPGLEAMACGCVLAASRYKGVFEYAQDGVNALLSPVADAQTMAENIVKIFEDDALRIRLAENAQKTGANRSLRVAAEKFAETLSGSTL